jgi:RHS repeat-associated protein
MTQSGSGAFSPTYNAATNQYATLPGGTPSYSATGAVTNDGSHSYAWDSENKNVGLDSASVTMTYDALGRWVERGTPAGYSQAIYAPDGSEFAVMAGASLVTAYVHLPQGALANYGSSGLSAYWHPDWLGTPRLYSSTSNTVIADVAYAPYGEQYQGAVIDTFFGGAGQIVEANDLRTYPARNLSAAQGRWQSPDPAGLEAVDLTNPQSLNRYAYVLGNPLGNRDPSGMYAEANTTDNDDDGFYRCCNFFFFPVNIVSRGGGGGNPKPPAAPSMKAAPPAKSGTNKPGYCNVSGSSSIVTLTGTKALTEVGAFIGSAFGPEGTLVGAVLGSQFGAGGNIAYVNATHSVYVGVTGTFAPVQIGGGGGFSVSYTPVPATQNANSIANGTSYGVSFQANPLLGSTVSKSPGSGPPVVGFQVGTRSPVSFSASHNICLWHCGC